MAETAEKAMALGYEIGLCHDLLEDTGTTATGLRDALQNFGYTESDSVHITAAVVELTDVFTRGAYPELSKASRKEREAERLTMISPMAQTVKYADLISNIAWVMKHDRGNAETYLQKKQRLLTLMDKGERELRLEAIALVVASLRELRPA
ncbi:hypothetical protein [Mucilaginibacter sp.]|uniref:hypothetical protein n=1 Tax=Mucilaginibacter sp. TaxID=1882438 RepID=UPI003D0983B1